MNTIRNTLVLTMPIGHFPWRYLYLIAPFIQSIKKQYLVTSCVFFLAGAAIFSIFNANNVLLKFLFQFNFYFALGQTIYFYRREIVDFLASKNLKRLLIVSSVLLFLAFDFLAMKNLEFWANFLSAGTGGLVNTVSQL